MYGSAALCLGLLGSMVSDTYLTLLVFMIIGGLGFGAYEIAINVICAVSNNSNKGNAMNFLHFFFGFGAIFGPILATVCLKLFTSWRLVFGLSALLPFGVMVMLMRSVIEIQHSTSPAGNTRLFKERLLWVCGIFIFIYVGIEVSIQGWIAVFFEKMTSDSFIPASLTASFFWITLTLGRLVSGKLADRIGLMGFLSAVSLCSMILALVWVFAHFAVSTLLLILLLGFLLAGVFPTQMALTTSFYPGMAGMITAFISGFASLGVFVIPAAFGKIADWAGILHLPTFIFGLSVLMFAFVLFQKKLAEEFLTKHSLDEKTLLQIPA